MSDATPQPAPPKTIFASMTFWLQVVTLLAALFPTVQTFISQNPESAVAVLAAVNVLVRFATSGKVSIFPASQPEGMDDRKDVNQDGNSGGNVLSLIGLCAAVGLMGFSLPSCSPGWTVNSRGWPVTVSYQDPMTDARIVIISGAEK